MFRLFPIFCFVGFITPDLHAQLAVSGQAIKAHVRFLSSDLLEGRGVGTRGGDLATEYLATQLALAGARPAGDNGTYFQRVPLVGVTTKPDSEISVRRDGKTISFKIQDEWVGGTLRQVPTEDFEADLVFVGHGIESTRYHWNDFKNVNVRGKVLVLFTNEPQPDNPEVFEGKTLTYYGRWTYKYEEAARRGALGCLIVHTSPTAGYGWGVLRNSGSREQPQIELKGRQDLALAGWLTEDAGEKLFGMAGKTVKQLLEAADSRDFQPIPLGIRLHAKLNQEIRHIESRNVAGIIPGNDPARKNEAVLYSAHWDHLGVGLPVKGDAIYNGAIDNGTGLGIVLETAHAWGALETKPRRSALFLFFTAEEAGLLGAKYYAMHPLLQPGKSAVDINYDALDPLGVMLDIVVPAADRTTLYPVIRADASRNRLELKPDPRPEQGGYYRSDQFMLARVGIPAFRVGSGSGIAGKSASYAAERFTEYNAVHYHQPSDEFHEDWDFAGLEQAARFGFMIGLDTANMDEMPRWVIGDEFEPARSKSLAGTK